MEIFSTVTARVAVLALSLALAGCAVGVAGGSIVSDGRVTTVRTSSATVDGQGLSTRTRRVDVIEE